MDNFPEYGRELWLMTLTFILDLDRVQMGRCAKYLRQTHLVESYCPYTPAYTPDRLLNLDHFSGRWWKENNNSQVLQSASGEK